MFGRKMQLLLGWRMATECSSCSELSQSSTCLRFHHCCVSSTAFHLCAGAGYPSPHRCNILLVKRTNYDFPSSNFSSSETLCRFLVAVSPPCLPPTGQEHNANKAAAAFLWQHHRPEPLRTFRQQYITFGSKLEVACALC